MGPAWDLLFSYFLSQKQGLRPLGYCAPPPPLRAKPWSAERNQRPKKAEGGWTRVWSRNMKKKKKKQQEREKFSCEDKLESRLLPSPTPLSLPTEPPRPPKPRLSLSHKKGAQRPRSSLPRTITEKNAFAGKRNKNNSGFDFSGKKSSESSEFGRNDPDVINQRNGLISQMSLWLSFEELWGKGASWGLGLPR